MRQYPINEEEDGNARSDGEDFHHEKSDDAHESASVAAQQELHERDWTSSQRDRKQGKRSACKGESERYDLIPQIRAVLVESPYAVQSDFQRQENSRRCDQQNHQRNKLHSLTRIDHRVQ